MEDAWIRCNVHYYLREKCYGKARTILEEGSTKFSNQSELNFYHGISHILEGQIQNGISELTVLQNDKDISVAVLIALVYGYKLSNSSDRETLYSLESRLKEERKQAGPKTLYYAGLFLSLVGKYEKAAEYTNKALRKDPNSVEILLLKSWIDMLSSTDMQMATLDCLELAISKSNKNPEALLGLARFKYLTKDCEASNLTLDRLIVSGPNQVVPLVEKMRNEFSMKKWEMVYDTLERIFMLDPENIQAYKMRIFLSLCKNSDYIDASDQLNRLYGILENAETYNGFQFYSTAQVFSKICGRSSSVLTQVYRFAKYASEIYPNNVDYMSEVGYQCMLQGKVRDALSFFKAASKIDSNSINALCGLTLCQIAESGTTEQVSQQIELLFEMQGSAKMPLLYLVSAKINEKISSNAVPLLNEAFETKIACAKRYPYSLAYVKELDPDFLLDVYKEYKHHLPKRPIIIVGYLMYTQDRNNSLCNSCFRILETVCKACPGLISALYELAKLKFQFGFSSEAHRIAAQIGELDNTHAGSQLLLAQIYVQQQSFAKASRCLETCLSYNFKVKDSAMYNFLQGVIHKSSNNLKEALGSLSSSIAILNSKNTSNLSKQFDSDLSIIDKGTLYVMIIELQSSLGMSEAGITMQEAIQELSYTSEEPRLSIVKADLAIHKGDIDKAIDILNDIKPGQSYYFQAHTKLAHIYLKEKNNREMFTTCFKEVVSNHPMADAHTLMGDAYLSINEPIQAAASYETALKDDSTNIQLIKKLGAALVKTHEYERAIQHYENAIQRLNDDELKFDYVDLLAKLKQYDKADAKISEELNMPRNKDKDVSTMKRRVRWLMKQSHVREMKDPAAGNTALILTEAKELQTVVVKRLEIDGRGDIQEEKRELSSILCALAKTKSTRELATAANLYAEALLHSPRDPATLLLLAKLYAQMNNPEKCEQTLSVLLNAEPNNEAAAVMMADLAFRKVDLETAERHLSQCVTAWGGWRALAALIDVRRRLARLSDVMPLLHAARDRLGDAAGDEPGYNYCQGLYSLYSGKPQAALRELNAARRSPSLRPAASKRMALLCVAQQTGDIGDCGDGDTRQLAIRTAEKLLPEIEPAERRGVQALVQVATRQKSAAERVLQEVLPSITDDTCQDDPYLILAIAQAYNIIKQPTRAKNILKRTISAIPWTPENADGLERCWVEAAEQQAGAGRGEAARELLARTLRHDRACSQAHHLLGQLAEKEQSYKMAAQHYDNAWVHSGKTNLAVGFKLAHAYLKLKKYPECIVVCRHILSIHPDYPKLRKDILEKAKNNLRT